jgi:hypothetical protein
MTCPGSPAAFVSPQAAARQARRPRRGGLDRQGAAVARVAQELAALAVLDLPGRLGGELELQPPVVDRPRAVGLHVDALVGVGDQVVERAGIARREVDVGHADDRLAGEAVGAHAAAGALEADLGGGLA